MRATSLGGNLMKCRPALPDVGSHPTAARTAALAPAPQFLAQPEQHPNGAFEADAHRVGGFSLVARAGRQGGHVGGGAAAVESAHRRGSQRPVGGGVEGCRDARRGTASTTWPCCGVGDRRRVPAAPPAPGTTGPPSPRTRKRAYAPSPWGSGGDRVQLAHVPEDERPQDDTIAEVHGYAKQGAGFGDSRVRGLNARLAAGSAMRYHP